MKKIFISFFIIAALLFVSCGSSGNGNIDDDNGNGDSDWVREMEPFELILSDNFEYGTGYQRTFQPAELFDGEKVTKDSEYTLQVTFTASRNLEGLLFAGIVDQNSASTQPNPYWTELVYPQGPETTMGVTLTAATILADDAADVERGVQFAGPDKDTIIQAGQEITATFEWIALRDSSGTLPQYNAIYFQTRGEGTTGTANSGTAGPVTLSFTQFVFTKIDAGNGDSNGNNNNECNCPPGTKHFEGDECGINCECTIVLRPATSYKVTSPYHEVDWDTWDQYKASLHIHTTSSDGSATITQMVDNYYSKDYDILAITDHNYLGLPYTSTWTENRYTGTNPALNPRVDANMTIERYTEITTGVGRDGRIMVAIPDTSEMATFPDEFNTYWWTGAPAGNNWSQIQTLNAVQAAGGLSSLNHPGRATGGGVPGNDGFFASMNEAHVNRYAGYFLNYSTLTTMEIINRADGDSYHDRVLWDNLLKITVPQGKNIYGRADDDSHSTNAIGNGWNMFIMPENTVANIRSAMENGNFYAVSRYAYREGIDNRTGAAPAINRIAIANNDSLNTAITITVQHADKVDFITERQGPLGVYNIVHTVNRPEATAATEEWEATIVLKDAVNARGEIVGCFVRANIVGSGGIAFSQPFMIERTLDMNAVLN